LTAKSGIFYPQNGGADELTLSTFPRSKTVEKRDKEEEVQIDQGADNDNTMGDIFYPEDIEVHQ